MIESRSTGYPVGIEIVAGQAHNPDVPGPILASLFLMSALGTELREVSVRIQQHGALPTKSIAGAEAIVSHIFAQSGIKVRWIEDEQADAVPVLFMTSKPSNVHGDVTGFAVLALPRPPCESYIGVVLPAADALAKREDFSLAAVLGATIAHEIGHVLLGSAHSINGVMSSRLTRLQLRMVESGTLLFPADESNRLRLATRRTSK